MPEETEPKIPLLTPEESLSKVREVPPPVDKSKKEAVVIPPPLSLQEFYSQEYGEIPYAVDQLILRDGVNMISGYSAAGKTHITLELALKMATGAPVFGHFPCPEKLSVLIVNEEDSPRSLQSRMMAMTKVINITTAPVYFHIQKGIKLDDDETIKQLIAHIKKLDINIVILDNLTRLHMLNENSSNEMNQIVENMKKITKAGAGVIVVHHNRKSNGLPGNMDNGAAIRGSGAIHAAMDIQITIERIRTPNPDEFFIGLQVTKNKEDQELPGIVKIQLETNKETGERTFSYLGYQDKELSAQEKLEFSIYKLLESAGASMTVKEIESSLKSHHRLTSEALSALMSQGKIKRTQLGRSYIYCVIELADRQSNIMTDDFGKSFDELT